MPRTPAHNEALRAEDSAPFPLSRFRICMYSGIRCQNREQLLDAVTLKILSLLALLRPMNPKANHIERARVGKPGH